MPRTSAQPKTRDPGRKNRRPAPLADAAPLLTIEQAREKLEERGESVAEFARAKGLDPATCYQVLYGTKKGRRGESHRCAVALGIKHGVVQ